MEVIPLIYGLNPITDPSSFAVILQLKSKTNFPSITYLRLIALFMGEKNMSQRRRVMVRDLYTSAAVLTSNPRCTFALTPEMMSSEPSAIKYGVFRLL